MTIRVKGTAIIDDDRNILNIADLAADGNLSGSIVATKNQAEAGTLNTKLMTPQRVKEAIEAILQTVEAPSVIKQVIRGETEFRPGADPVVVSLGATVNADKAFISSSIRGNAMINVQRDWAVSITGTASVKFPNSSGNNTQIVVEGGERSSNFNVSQAGTLVWEVVEFN